MTDGCPAEFSGITWVPHLPLPLVGCWVLGDHWDHDRHRRTGIGDLVYRGKTYEGKPGDRLAAEQLADCMAAGAEVVRDRGRFPLIEVDLVVPVPAFPPKEPFNLPDVLAIRVAASLGVALDQDLLVKHATTPPAKTESAGSVEAAIRAAYRVNRQLAGETVLLVDDLVRKGTTLATLARLLCDGGAGVVGGYVASRATKGL